MDDQVVSPRAVSVAILLRWHAFDDPVIQISSGLKYRFAGKEKRVSLGVYPDVGPKKARDRRDETCKLVADGVDLRAARKQEKIVALDAAL